MENIDLTKCVNLRFRLRIDGTNYFGRIGTDERGRNCLFCDDGKAYWIADSSDELQRYGKSYLEIFPRDPETYQDWQVGDVIYSFDDEGNTVSGEDEMCRVIFRSGELVAIAENYSAEEADINGCYTCSQLFREGWRLVLTDIEQKIIEEKKKREYEPQDGDVCYTESKTGYNDVFIYKAGYRKTEYYVATKTVLTTGAVVSDNFIAELRPATEEERQGLFDALKERGKRWNAERKVVEDIPKPYEFRKGEPVLVKDEGGKWCIGVFIQRENSFYGYRTRPADGIGEIGYRYCLPYNERTMHLLGTSEDYKEGE